MEQIYNNMPWLKDYIVVTSIANDIFRSLGFAILKVFSTMIDSVYGAIEAILLLDFMEIDAIKDFIDKLSPVAWLVFAACLCFAGILIMFYPNKGKDSHIQGVFLSLIFMVSIPLMFTTLNQFRTAATEDLGQAISEEGKPGKEMLRNSIMDVQNSTDKLVTLDSSEDPYYLEINTRISEDNTTFTHKITKVKETTMEDGTTEAVIFGEPLGNGFFGIGKEELYAYNYKFVETLLIQLVTLIALVFAGFKLARHIYDIIVYQVAAPIIYASDVNNTGRSKKFTQKLVAIYISFAIILVLMKIYLDLTTWATLNVPNVWVRIFLIAGASWGLIDGPDAIISLLGVDAGVKSASSMLMGGMAAMSIAGGVKRGVQGIGNVAGNIANGTAGAAGGIAGGVSGLKNASENYQFGKDIATSRSAQEKAGGLVDNFKDFKEVNNSRFEGTPTTPKGDMTAGYNNTPRKGIGGIIDSAKGGYNSVQQGISKTAASAGYVTNKTDLEPPTDSQTPSAGGSPIESQSYPAPKHEESINTQFVAPKPTSNPSPKTTPLQPSSYTPPKQDNKPQPPKGGNI